VRKGGLPPVLGTRCVNRICSLPKNLVVSALGAGVAVGLARRQVEETTQQLTLVRLVPDPLFDRREPLPPALFFLWVADGPEPFSNGDLHAAPAAP
jgi:hypothetical protein